MPRTFQPTAGQLVGWRLVDATDQPLGRLSTYVVNALMGKDKAGYSPSMDAGDHVVVINARNVKLTGNKWQDKRYHYHTNYPGGIKTFTARELLAKHPEWLIQWAVWGMLPKSKGPLARKWYKKLRVFPGAEHPHQAQKPTVIHLPNLGTWEKA
jgi:large subunit ribosomal protein L13